jgi:AcrR family transcriptional regulator
MSGAETAGGDRILDIAADHLRRQGLARLRVVSVAAEAGMSHSNVYRYFPSKEALADAVIARWLTEIDRALMEAANAPDPGDDKLERMLHLIAAGYRRKLVEDPALFAVFADAAAEERLVARRHRTRVRDYLERALEEAVSTGLLPAARRNAQTALLFDAAYRFLHPAAVRLDAKATEQSLRERRERVFAAVLQELRAMAGVE